MLDKIKGEIRVFTREVESPTGTMRVIFNACVGSTKIVDEDENVNYINYYMPINFSKAVNKQVAKVYKNDSFDIIIKESWIKAYVGKDELTHPILFVNDAKVITNDEDDEEEDKPKPKKASSKSTAKKSTKSTSKKSQKAELELVDYDYLPF